MIDLFNLKFTERVLPVTILKGTINLHLFGVKLQFSN